MGALIANKQVVGVKLETTQDTAVAPGATDMMLAEVIFPDILIESLKRDYKRSNLSTLTAVRGTTEATFKIKTEVKGSGTAGTAYAPLGSLLVMAGCSETVVAVTSVTYAPVSAPNSSSWYTVGKSGTVEIYHDGLKYIFKGCVVESWDYTSDAAGLGMIEFTIKGHYPTISDASIASATYLAQAPKVWDSSTISIHSSSALLVRSWKISQKNTVVKRLDAAAANGVKGFMVSGREVTGQLVAEMEKIATFDYYAKMKAGTEASASFTLGGTAGNILTVTMSKTQFEKVSQSEDSGILLATVDYVANQSSGDDDYSIAFT